MDLKKELKPNIFPNYRLKILNVNSLSGWFPLFSGFFESLRLLKGLG